MSLHYVIRLGRPSDLPFVVDSWVKKGRQPDERFSAATARVRNILARETTLLKVAVLADDDDAILGWAVLEPGVCRYVYVRKDARGQGIAKALLK